jgi:hypothetical protein
MPSSLQKVGIHSHEEKKSRHLFFYRLSDKHGKVWYSIEKSILFQDHTEEAQMVCYTSSNGTQFLIINSDYPTVSGVRFKITDNLELVLSNSKEHQDEIDNHALRLNFDYIVEFNPSQPISGKTKSYLLLFLLPTLAVLILIGFGLVYVIRRVRKGGRFIHDNFEGSLLHKQTKYLKLLDRNRAEILL